MRNSSPGIIFFGILAVLFGLIGAYGAKKYLQDQEAPAAEPPAAVAETTITVPLAIRDLPEGRTIAIGDFTTVKLTEPQIRELGLPPGFMSRSSQIIGRTLRSPVMKSQAFLPEAFFPDGIGPDIARRLAPGERAITIPFADGAAQAGLITPGATVDVLFRTMADAEQGVPEATMTLLESVNVLAVDREIEEGATPGAGGRRAASGTVTLAVTPVQARALKVVEDRGTLSLVLCGSEPMHLVSTVEPEPELSDDPAAAEVEDLLSPPESLPREKTSRSRNGNELAPMTLNGLLGIREPSEPRKLEIYRRGRLTTVLYGEEGRTVIEEAPYGMPVAAQPRAAADPAVSQRSGKASPQATDSAAAADAGCGCGSPTATTSALFRPTARRAPGL